MWYPNPAALYDLIVTKTEDGFEFSAPDNTECAAWLGHYNSSEELHAEFSNAIIGVITDYIEDLESGSSQQDTQRL